MRNKIKEFINSENLWIGVLRDLVFIVAIVAIFASLSHIILGLWTPMFAVESGSMIPHIQIGDIIFVESFDRTEIITYEDGKEKNYISFGDYGNVILYKKQGSDKDTPIIHRAMYYVEKGETMWNGGPPAPHSGYITKGDNPETNPWYDQQGTLSFQKPVKKEWIIGVARFSRIPVLGYVSLTARKMFFS